MLAWISCLLSCILYFRVCKFEIPRWKAPGLRLQSYPFRFAQLAKPEATLGKCGIFLCMCRPFNLCCLAHPARMGDCSHIRSALTWFQPHALLSTTSVSFYSVDLLFVWGWQREPALLQRTAIFAFAEDQGERLDHCLPVVHVSRKFGAAVQLAAAQNMQEPAPPPAPAVEGAVSWRMSPKALPISRPCEGGGRHCCKQSRWYDKYMLILQSYYNPCLAVR